jgi:purine-cytosine permease-like protein
VEYLIVLWISAVLAAYVASSRGNSALAWFFLSLCMIVPFLGLIIAFFYRREDEELRRQCPGCGRIVKLHDAICTRCGTELDFPDVAIEPESAARQPPQPAAR